MSIDLPESAASIIRYQLSMAKHVSRSVTPPFSVRIILYTITPDSARCLGDADGHFPAPALGQRMR